MGMRSSSLLGLLPLLAIAACGSHTGGSSPGGSAGAAGLQANIGPIDVPAGVETTQCIVVPLGNTEDVVMNGYTINLSEGSHHLIVYLTTDSAQSDPVNCTPVRGPRARHGRPRRLREQEERDLGVPRRHRGRRSPPTR